MSQSMMSVYVSKWMHCKNLVNKNVIIIFFKYNILGNFLLSLASKTTSISLTYTGEPRLFDSITDWVDLLVAMFKMLAISIKLILCHIRRSYTYKNYRLFNYLDIERLLNVRFFYISLYFIIKKAWKLIVKLRSICRNLCCVLRHFISKQARYIVRHARMLPDVKWNSKHVIHCCAPCINWKLLFFFRLFFYIRMIPNQWLIAVSKKLLSFFSL